MPPKNQPDQCPIGDLPTALAARGTAPAICTRSRSLSTSAKLYSSQHPTSCQRFLGFRLCVRRTTWIPRARSRRLPIPTCTLYPIPYIVYRVPYTMYRIPYTLRCTPYTVYPVPYISDTLYRIPYTLNPIPPPWPGLLVDSASEPRGNN